MIYFGNASKQELLTIALYEDCDFDYKYEALRELEYRKYKNEWKDEMLTELVVLYGKGYSIYDIADDLGVSEGTVRYYISKYKLKRVRKRKAGYKCG